jgi:hypothetical protein
MTVLAILFAASTYSAIRDIQETCQDMQKELKAVEKHYSDNPKFPMRPNEEQR